MDELLHSRRAFLKTSGTAVAVALASKGLGEPGKTGSSLERLRAERKKLAHRRRRIIFSNDGDDLNQPGSDTPEGLLKVRTTALLGSQVDSIFYYSSNGLKLFLSDNPYSKLYLCPDPVHLSTANNNLRQLLKNYGKDALEVMIDTCRQRGMEIFFANRMNGTDGIFSNPPVLFNISNEHPEYLLSTIAQSREYQFPDVRSFGPSWNFELPVIRKMTVDALRQVCQTYDIDGIELEFDREPLFFYSTMQGKATTPKQNAMMSEMVREIRRMTEEEGLKRGRPILVGAQIAMNSALSRMVGVDVETWLKEDLIDLVTIMWRANMLFPMKGTIGLGHRYGAPVYPCVANYGYKNARRGDGITPPDFPMYRGDALFRYWEGADGMYMFNVFDPTLALWHELGDPKQLRTLDRSYVWDYLLSLRNTSNSVFEMKVATMPTPRNVPVTDGGSEPIPLMLGEDLGQELRGGAQATTLKLRLHVTGLTSAQGLTVTVNGQGLGEAKEVREPKEKEGGFWLEFSPAPALFHAGENRVQASLGEHWERTVNPPQIDHARLDVEHT